MQFHLIIFLLRVIISEGIRKREIEREADSQNWCFDQNRVINDNGSHYFSVYCFNLRVVIIFLLHHRKRKRNRHRLRQRNGEFGIA